MAKYKVLEDFRDKHTEELYTAGTEIEMTVKRAGEVEKNLAKYGKVFLERVEETKTKETSEEGKK